MTREELIVNAAVAIYDGDGARDGAIKAIDIVLEEAAKVAEKEAFRLGLTPSPIAAAIRALKD